MCRNNAALLRNIADTTFITVLTFKCASEQSTSQFLIKGSFMNFRIRQCNKLQHLYQLKDAEKKAFYQNKLIPNAQAYVPPVPFGDLLIQRVSLLNIIFWNFDITIQETSTIEFYPDTPAFAFHYMVENNIPFKLNGKTKVLKEGESTLLFLRNINYEVTLEPGNYIFIHVDPSYLIWQQLYEHYPEIRNDIELAAQTLGCFLNMPHHPISDNEMQLIHYISTQPATRGRSILQQVAIDLIRLFLDKSKPDLSHQNEIKMVR